ncbi:MAG: peptidyl-prolyl cis-trans isomerase [Alphaproteobacteria bacterium]|nr:peptidyl-prolyl cis-trans isomerase [Alphaproteobacteria bacterium]
MQKKYLLATSAIIVVLLAGAATYKVWAEKNNGVAAVVNGEQITVAEVKEAYEANPQIKAQVPFEDFYNRALDVMVNGKLALQAATKANVQASAEYQKELAQMQEDLARKVYIDQQVEARVTDAEVKAFYDKYVAEFKSVKEIKAKHILVDTEELAEEIIKKLDKKAKFDDLAREYSKDQPDLGYFTEEMMVPEFSTVAFNMEKGTYSKKPVKTEFGYHVIYVEDIRDSKPLELEMLEPQIKANLAQQAIDDVIADLQKDAQIEKFDLNGKKIKVESEQDKLLKALQEAKKSAK